MGQYRVFADMLILASADTLILLILDRGDSKLSKDPQSVKIGPVDAKISATILVSDTDISESRIGSVLTVQ